MTADPISRRNLLTRIALVAPVLTFRPDIVAAAAAGALIASPPKPAPLPNVTAGSVITAESWNAIVDRLNELSNGGGRA